MRHLLMHTDEMHYQCKLYSERFIYDTSYKMCINYHIMERNLINIQYSNK